MHAAPSGRRRPRQWLNVRRARPADGAAGGSEERPNDHRTDVAQTVVSAPEVDPGILPFVTRGLDHHPRVGPGHCATRMTGRYRCHGALRRPRPSTLTEETVAAVLTEVTEALSESRRAWPTRPASPRCGAVPVPWCAMRGRSSRAVPLVGHSASHAMACVAYGYPLGDGWPWAFPAVCSSVPILCVRYLWLLRTVAHFRVSALPDVMATRYLPGVLAVWIRAEGFVCQWDGST
ncbi:MAG: hypothetical protein QOH97_5554 [Actinoplanes sp.]|jgi:hypothetical protein|nr:hypothetical protein [Actinoplanes sp.]